MTRTMTDDRRLGALSILIGPIAWALQLLVGYVLTTVSCNMGTKASVYGLSIVAGLVIVVAGLAAFQSWRSLAGRPDVTDLERPQSRSEFLVVAGVFVSSLFFLLVLATGVFAIFLNPCPVITQPMP